jgi:hypothetical protein
VPDLHEVEPADRRTSAGPGTEAEDALGTALARPGQEGLPLRTWERRVTMARLLAWPSSWGWRWWRAIGGLEAEHYPTVDQSCDRLHRAGWSLGEYAVGPPHALVWWV